ncbi:MAG: VCBS repeat-containing protein [Chlorobi bacterium]|nr:VCBS repeat-containing protein [Chlorobiota bacterium]
MVAPLLKYKQQLLRASVVISAVLFIPVYFLFPDFSKYQLNFISESNCTPRNIEIYNDLNQDGSFEKISFDKDFLGTPAILTEEKGKILYQWNLTGKFINNPFYHFADYNHDGQKEIYVLTRQNDSIFLHVAEGITGKIIARKVFISTFGRHAGKPDFTTNTLASEDLNNDGINEFIIPIMCGFSYTTRKLCIYDFAKKELKTSPVSGVTTYAGLFFYDINNDGDKEVFGTISAFGNCREEYPYSDTCCWLQVLNSNSDYIFKPFKLGHSPSVAITRPIIHNGKSSIAVFFKHTGTRNDSTFLALYTPEGQLLKKRIIPYRQNLRNETLFTHYPEKVPNRLILYREDGLLETYNSNLELLSSKKSVPFTGNIKSTDLDNDGEKEHILHNQYNGDIIVTRNNFKSPVKIKTSLLLV